MCRAGKRKAFVIIAQTANEAAKVGLRGDLKGNAAMQMRALRQHLRAGQRRLRPRQSQGGGPVPGKPEVTQDGTGGRPRRHPGSPGGCAVDVARLAQVTPFERKFQVAQGAGIRRSTAARRACGAPPRGTLRRLRLMGGPEPDLRPRGLVETAAVAVGERGIGRRGRRDGLLGRYGSTVSATARLDLFAGRVVGHLGAGEPRPPPLRLQQRVPCGRGQLLDDRFRQGASEIDRHLGYRMAEAGGLEPVVERFDGIACREPDGRRQIDRLGRRPGLGRVGAVRYSSPP